MSGRDSAAEDALAVQEAGQARAPDNGRRGRRRAFRGQDGCCVRIRVTGAEKSSRSGAGGWHHEQDRRGMPELRIRDHHRRTASARTFRAGWDADDRRGRERAGGEGIPATNRAGPAWRRCERARDRGALRGRAVRTARRADAKGGGGSVAGVLRGRLRIRLLAQVVHEPSAAGAGDVRPCYPRRRERNGWLPSPSGARR